MTKLGPHTLNSDTQAAQWARAGAPIIKMAGDFSFAPEAAILPHRPLIIGRRVENFFDPNRLINQNPIDTARWYVADFLDTHIRLNPAVQAWEGPNECVVTELPEMRWYAEFLREFSRIIKTQYNKTPVIGSWAVGNPHYDMWMEYGPALEATRLYGAILGRHNYAGPDQSTWGYLLLRHREDNRIFSSMGYPNAPVVITESGADGVPFGNPPGQAWRDLYGDDAARYCIEILFPFDAALQSDPYVIGAVVFTSGGESTWPRHDIGGRVADLLISNTRPTEPPIDPPPGDGATHVVLAAWLNVRLWPWVGGQERPPAVRLLEMGTRVRVEGVYKPDPLRKGWGCLNTIGNEWVNMSYLGAL